MRIRNGSRHVTIMGSFFVEASLRFHNRVNGQSRNIGVEKQNFEQGFSSRNA
jgi:hypothetical protein